MNLESNALYEAQQFKNLIADGAQIGASEFISCSFAECSFKESAFDACTFRDCIFENCDLSLVKVPKSSFKNTKFVKSKLIGVDWGKAAWSNKKTSSLLKSIDFVECVLNFSFFIGLSLERISVENCIAHDVDFSESNLSKASFHKTDLMNSRFRQTILREANFVSATNYTIDPGANDIKQARFSLPEAMALLYSMDVKIEHENGPDPEAA